MNWLVDEPGYNTKSKVNNIHFTKGEKFKEYANCSYSETQNQYHEECSKDRKMIQGFYKRNNRPDIKHCIC